MTLINGKVLKDLAVFFAAVHDLLYFLQVKAKKPDEETPKDQGAPRTAEEILAEGGCKFPDGPLPNGKEVHPSIHSHGEQRCVTCRCKVNIQLL